MQSIILTHLYFLITPFPPVRVMRKGGGEEEGERERGRGERGGETDRETERDTPRNRDRQTDRETDKHTDRDKERKREREVFVYMTVHARSKVITSLHTFTYLLTLRIVGARKMISQSVSSIVPCSPLPSET